MSFWGAEFLTSTAGRCCVPSCRVHVAAHGESWERSSPGTVSAFEYFNMLQSGRFDLFCPPRRSNYRHSFNQMHPLFCTAVLSLRVVDS